MKITYKFWDGIKNTIIVLFFITFWTLFIGAIGMASDNIPCHCECPDHQQDKVEFDYSELVRPIHVEAVGFQGIILRDATGTVLVCTDDKALHEVLTYSYNVGDTIQ